MTSCFASKNLKALLIQQPGQELPEVPDEPQLLQAMRDKVGPFASKDKLLWHLRASRGKVHWAVNSYLRAVLQVPPAHPAGEDFDAPSTQQLQQHQQEAQPSQHAQQQQQQAPDLVSGQQPQQTCSSTLGVQLHTAADAAAQGEQECAGTTTASSNNNGAQGVILSSPLAAAAAADTAAAGVCLRLDGLPANVLELILSCLDLASLLHAAGSCQALHRSAQAEGLWRSLFHARWGPVLFPTQMHGSSGGSGGSGSGGSAVQQATTAAGSSSCTATAAEGSAGGSSHSAHSVGRADAAAAAAAVSAPPGHLKSRAPVPCFSAAAAAAAAGGAAAGAAPEAAVSGATTPQQQQQQEGHGFVRRWTGSSCAPRSNTAVNLPTKGLPEHGSSSTSNRPAQGSPGSHSPQASVLQPPQQQQHQKQQQQQQQRTHLQHQQHGASAASELPLGAPSGSWQRQFRQQYDYQASRTCPHCGACVILPIVYGYPSAALLSGMAAQQQRVVLGGDHLIDSCHVWACSGCRSCYRFYPYINTHLWLQDDAQQQRRDRARAAAAGRGSGSSSHQGQGSGGDGGGVAAGAAGGGFEAQEAAGHQVTGQGSSSGPEGFPRYTFEL